MSSDAEAKCDEAFAELAELVNEPADPVNSPPHYTSGPIEVIDIIEGFRLGFCLGNVVKYILRAPHKGAELQDLKKAEWYLRREIQRMEKEREMEAAK